MRAPSDEFLRYYLEELSYLRAMGGRFAEKYAKVAGRLELRADECPDPHVERLIESFAFLTARIQSDLDADFPEIAAELLNVLYPHYLAPVPSMSIARFEFDPERAKLTSGKQIPQHTKLFSVTTDGQICRMRTAYPVTLWPIEVTEAEIVDDPATRYAFLGDDVRSLQRLRIYSDAESLGNLGVDRLRFFIDGDPVLVSALYGLLFENARYALNGSVPRRTPISLFNVATKTHTALPPGALQQVGFGEDEAVIEYPAESHPAYRLLQEYFAFPDKFHFFDVAGLQGAAAGEEIELLLPLERMPRTKLVIAKDTFPLGCTPIVNLFRKTSEPIRVDHRQLEYRLVPDMRREKTTEIHSILSVSGSSDETNRSRQYARFYSFTHAMEQNAQKAYWHARRVEAVRPGMSGTDMLLSFCDLEFDPATPPEEIVFAHLLCTNRGLAAELPADALLQTDESFPVAKDGIYCLKKPTRPLPPPLGGQDLWRLVSHLSLNYLSLSEGKESLKALHEILELYCFSDAPSLRQQIHSIRDVTQRKVSRRVAGNSWNGFSRGTAVSLTVDDAPFVGSSAILFGSVLHHFLALHASVNSFTQLAIRRPGREGEWQWPPMVGGKPVL